MMLLNPLHLDKTRIKPILCKTPPLRFIDAKTFPKESYRSRRGEYKAGFSWGQLKLLLSEIEFFTDFCHLNCESNATVLYVGAAPGSHIIYLISLFPKLKWILYDPAKFVDFQNYPNVQVFNDFFTDKEAKNYEGKIHVYISDIRTADILKHSSEDVEIAVDKDMQAQLRWYYLMKPNYASLKFRLPWILSDKKTREKYYVNEKGTRILLKDFKYEYPKGKIQIQPFTPRTSTESRLFINNADDKKIIYDPVEYESHLFYHNTKNRLNYYIHDCIDSETAKFGLCMCYDCTSMVYILKDYVETVLQEKRKEKVTEITKLLIRNLNSISVSQTRNLHIKRQITLAPRTLDNSQKSEYAAGVKPTTKRKVETT